MRPFASIPGILIVTTLACQGIALAETPAREVDRPLVTVPGTSEVSAEPEYSAADRYYGEDSRIRGLPPEAVVSAASVTFRGRYGLFQGLEVFIAAPWIIRLDPRGGDPVSGAGRVALGSRYEIQPRGGTYLAGEVALVLPTTAPRLRTGESGQVFRDHLAVSGSLLAKHSVVEWAAVHASAGFSFPFANADDQAADRDPPATLHVRAGSTFQVDDRFWTDASATFTRTNSNRVAGGLVPRSDQYILAFRPSIGVHLGRHADLSLSASLPVTGKNTPRAFGASVLLRTRF